MNEKYDHIANIDWAWNNSFFPTWVRAGTGDFYAGNPPFPLPAWNSVYPRNVRSTTWKTDYLQFSPRVGMAYNLNSKTVIRTGFGIYFPHDLLNTAFDVSRNQPFTIRINSTSNTLIPNATWTAPSPSSRFPRLAPSWVYGRSQPKSPQWSFNVSVR